MHLSSRNNSNERDMVNLLQLIIPFYESTKGTNSEERTLLIKRLASTAGKKLYVCIFITVM